MPTDLTPPDPSAILELISAFRRTQILFTACELGLFDPLAEPKEALHEYGVELEAWEHLPKAAAIVAAVSHKPLVDRPIDDYLEKLQPGGLYVDVKCQADAEALRTRGVRVWRL